MSEFDRLKRQKDEILQRIDQAIRLDECRVQRDELFDEVKRLRESNRFLRATLYGYEE